MNMKKTIKGIAMGTSLAAFVTLGVPATSSAHGLAHQTAEKKAGKKKDEKKDDKKKDEKKGEEGEGSCGEGSCGGDHKKDEGKK